MPIFGCVADDFTGASDAASFLVKGGMSVQLFNGIPAKESRIAEGIQAIVIALKSRTQDTGEAVADTMRSLGWLKEQGVEKFYLKYCSTFDSTPEEILVLLRTPPWNSLGCPIRYCVRPCLSTGVW